MAGEFSPQKGLIEFRTHYRWAVITATVLFLALFFRFFLVQIIRGESYERLAQISYIGRQRIPARRGEILDAHNRVLARNVARFDIGVVPHYLERSLKNPRAAQKSGLSPLAAAGGRGGAAALAGSEDDANPLWRLRNLLGLSAKQYEEIALKVQRNLTKQRRFNKVTILRDIVADRCPDHGIPLELREARERLWCPACGQMYLPLGPGQTRCSEDNRPLAFEPDRRGALCGYCGARYAAHQRCPTDGTALESRTLHLICPLCGRPFDNQAAVVTAHLHELPGISVDPLLRRQYPYRQLLGHVVGFTNEANARDLEARPGVYQPGDFLGRSGVERGFENVLRGTHGDRIFYKDARGIPQESADNREARLGNLRSTESVSGLNVVLTVDAVLQRIVSNAFANVRSGAVVVMEPRTGRVLAIHSEPPFDPNEWSGRLSAQRYKEIMESPYAPMMNKALHAYAPGSVYKVVTALIGLHEGVVTSDTRFDCGGHYDFGRRRFRCHAHHAQPDLSEALMVSCDVYFYRLGEILGMDRLEQYARDIFGLERPTGIEIAEQLGRVPSKAWHAKHSAIGWQPGFSLSTAVGQGALLVSPLEMARVYSAIVNGGHLMKARIALQLTDDRGNVVRRFMPQEERRLPFSAEHLALVRQGLFRVVNEDGGTAFKSRLESVVMGGKTGTAEAAQTRRGASPEVAAWLREDHAWFVGYAPADSPEIVVVVFIEHGGSGGKEAAPIAAAIVQEYFARGLSRTRPDAEPPAAAGDEAATTETHPPAAPADARGRPAPDAGSTADRTAGARSADTASAPAAAAGSLDAGGPGPDAGQGGTP